MEIERGRVAIWQAIEIESMSHILAKYLFVPLYCDRITGNSITIPAMAL